MLWIVLPLLAILVFAIIALVLKNPKDRGARFPYSKGQALFSPAERSFLGVLDQAIGDEYRVFGKVRVADVVEPLRGLGNSARQKAFNRISAKHFDYVLCAKDDLSVVAVLELDDKSHRQRKRQERDAFLVGLCQAASLPLIQVPAQRAYSIPELRERVRGALRPPAEVEQHPLSVRDENERVEPFIGIDGLDEQATVVENETNEQIAPNCPKCGARMVARQSKAGGNAGRQFWGCSTFPKCRGVIERA